MAESEEVIIKVQVEGAADAENAIEGVTGALDENKDSLNKADSEQKAYNKTLSDSVKEVKIFGVSMNSLSAGFKGTVSQIGNSVKSLKAFKVALISTGIGAIVVALGSLIAAFASTQAGMDLVTKATDAMGAVLDVVIDRLVLFGKGLVEFFSGNFEKGIDQMASSFDGAATAIGEMIEQSQALSDATVKLEEDQNKFIVTNARLRAEMKEFNKIAEDTTKSIEERAAASQNAEAVEAKRAAEAIRLAKEELRIAQLRDAQGDSTREELAQTAELEARIFQIKEENAERLTTQANKTNILLKQLREQETGEIIEAETIRANNIISISEQTANRILDIRKDLTAQLELQRQLEATLEEQSLNSRLGLVADFFGAVGRLAGQNTEAGKALAVAQATINAYLGISGVWKAFAAPGPPFTLFGAIAQTATVAALALGNVKQILSTPIPKVQIESTPFADGGYIGGKPHSRGGTWINAERGEYMISKDRMAIPSVRRAAMQLNNYKQSGSNRYALGGEILGQNNILQSTLNEIMQAVSTPQIVLYKEDLDTVNTRVERVEVRASLA